MSTKIPSSQLTPEHIYFSRRQFLQTAGVVGAGALIASACGTTNKPAAPTPDLSTLKTGKDVDELGDKLTPYAAVTGYNNYYEFSTDKEDVASLAQNFPTRPWTVQVGGLVNKPKTYDIDDLLKKFTQQERIYRLRCVEAWSMVIPWQGFSLADLLRDVEPTSEAKYVKFTSLYNKDQMPGQRAGWYSWPYVEGLRMDEAMNELATLATGVYGNLLPPQNGAPLRLVVPWKYGFKSIKAITKIELVKDMPRSLWMAAASNEYGFYANVNPEVDHPRWSQGTERRIGELTRRRTLPFNGYTDKVAALYQGMDLRRNY
jgi:sulfoxide reductase catalytic subunit YedY